MLIFHGEENGEEKLLLNHGNKSDMSVDILHNYEQKNRIYANIHQKKNNHGVKYKVLLFL